MKIWLMNHYATSMFRDKAGRHFWFAKELKKAGHEVVVFCATTFLNGNNVIDTNGKKYSVDYADDIPFVFVKTTPCVGNGLDRVKNMVYFYLNLIPVAKKYAELNDKPDVIVASSVHPLTMVAGIKIAKKLGVPCICEIRDLWPEAIFSFGKAKENSILGKTLIAGEHWIYKNANALIFTKEGDTDYLKERKWTTAQGGDISLEKCHYINNGVDLPAYLEQIKNCNIDDADLEEKDIFNVTYTGTIRPVNNVGMILDCAKIIRDKGYSNIQFLIYGEGSELPKLTERIEKENILNVRLKGFVAKKYIPFILSKSSVNILNYSQNQYNWSRGNSSNKLFEYLASGKPVISTVKMGYSIIDKYNCGVELESCTAEALADEIIKFYNMPKQEYEELGANASVAASDFDFSILTKKLLKVIEGVVKE